MAVRLTSAAFLRLSRLSRTVPCTLLQKSTRQRLTFSHCRFLSTTRLLHTNDGVSDMQAQDVKNGIISAIIQRTTSVTTDSLLYHTAVFQQVLDFMLGSGFNDEEITDIFLTSPELLSFDGRVLEDTICFLRTEGFSVRQTGTLLKQCSDVVGMQEEILGVIGFLRDELNLSDSHLQDILTTNPELLFTSGKEMASNYSMLMVVFRKADLKRMIRKDPLILLQTEKEVEEKVNYVFHKMGQDQVEMVWSNILCYDIDYIRSRHELLKRVGKYEKPDKNGVTKKPNPLLKDIMGFSHTQFAKLAGVTLEEFEVFKKLLKIERVHKFEEFEFAELNIERDEDSDADEDDDRELDGYKAERVKRSRMKKKIID